MRISLQAVVLSAAVFAIAVSTSLPVQAGSTSDLIFGRVQAHTTHDEFALIKVCVRYAWRCPGLQKPVSRPRPGCTRYCAEERIFR